MITLKPMRGYGMVAADAAVFQPGSEPMYRDLLTSPGKIREAVWTFQTFAKARNFYFGAQTGSWDGKTELAWLALMPGAYGPTTTRMLEGLDAVSAAAFRPLETRYCIAIARDRYLERQGIYQREPDQDAHVDRMNLSEGSPAWDPQEVSVGQAMVTPEAATPDVQEPGDPDPVSDTPTANVDEAAGATAGGSAPTKAATSPTWWDKYKWWVVGTAAVAVAGTAGGVAWYYNRKKRAMGGIVLRGIVLR